MKHSLSKCILVYLLTALLTVGLSYSLTLNEKCGESVPTSPQIFQGYALYGGSSQGSQSVTATLDGVDFSATTNSDGFYSVGVSRCGNSTSTSISFTVCSRSASETASFSSSTSVPTNLNLTISSACPTTSTTTTTGGGGSTSSGGGGGGVAETSIVSLDSKPDFATSGTVLNQTQGNQATFKIDGTSYTAELKTLASDSATITVGAKTSTLKVGETALFDVDGDGSNDISITLESIIGGSAELRYKLLARPAKPAEQKPTESKPTTPATPSEPGQEVIPPKRSSVGWMIAIGIVVVGIVAFFIVRKKKSF